MLPTLQIGSLAIQTPGLILLIGIWFALDLADRQAPLFGQNGNRIFSLLIFILVGGLVGARLVFAAGNMQIFSDNPLSLFSFSSTLMSLPGGIIFAAAAGLAYGQRSKLPFWPTLDALSMAFAVLLIASSLANFASGDAYGSVTTLPWAINLWGALRHPTQFYETLAALTTAIAIWPRPSGRLAGWFHTAPGLRFWTWVGLSAFSRLFLETFRANSPLLLGQFREIQLIAWLILALSLWQISRRGWSAAKPTPDLDAS